MEVSKISFKRQWEYGKDAHYLQYYLIYSLKRQCRKHDTSTSIRERLLCKWCRRNYRQCPSEDDRCATCSLPKTSICNRSQWRRTPTSHWNTGEMLLVTAWNPSPTKAKISLSSTHTSYQMLHSIPTAGWCSRQIRRSWTCRTWL